MRVQEKADFLDQFTDLIIHIYFSFRVVLEKPLALVVFSIIVIIGLSIGIRQVYIYRKKTPWTEQNKKDLKIIILLFAVIVGIFYLVNKI